MRRRSGFARPYIAAPDGDEALRLVRTLRPDILLTDIEMPGRTGLEVAGEIKRGGLPTRAVILTTFARSCRAC